MSKERQQGLLEFGSSKKLVVCLSRPIFTKVLLLPYQMCIWKLIGKDWFHENDICRYSLNSSATDTRVISRDSQFITWKNISWNQRNYERKLKRIFGFTKKTTHVLYTLACFWSGVGSKFSLSFAQSERGFLSRFCIETLF